MEMEDRDGRAGVKRTSVNVKECNLASCVPTVAGQCEVRH